MTLPTPQSTPNNPLLSKDIMMNISVIGCGYLGAVHAACMAHLGHKVIGLDIDKKKVDLLNSGSAPFFEPGFEDILAPAVRSGRLRFTTDAADPELKETNVHFIAVGTPQSSEGKSANLRYVWEAVHAITTMHTEQAPHTPPPIVVGKSTVPVGTAQQIADTLSEYNIPLIWNPEFLREGFAVHDTLHPDRIVYGLEKDPTTREFSEDAHYAIEQLDGVYHDILEEGVARLLADYPTSELVKVAANSFLATKISFINAMAELCEATGGDVTVLADAIGRDERIGRRFLGAGIGFGGGCLPKDIRAFTARAEELGVQDAVSFLKDIDAINQRRRTRVIDYVMQRFEGNLEGKRITVLGAAFKPNSDDIRDSPALEIAQRLHTLGAQVCVTDPEALDNLTEKAPELTIEAHAGLAMRDADMVILATEWKQFTELDPHLCQALVRQPYILDARNALDPRTWREAGWEYQGLGR